MIYAGIGSRKTPAEIHSRMWELGYELAERGATLRSGHADNADMAFENGCIAASGTKEIYLPWAGFNGAPRFDSSYICAVDTRHLLIAAKFHPAWDRCSPAAKNLHARNVCQVLGANLDKPADMVICWTPNGSGSGGTGQAIRIASFYKVPVFDLGLHDSWQKMVNFVTSR